jgi:hypothetical protein
MARRSTLAALVLALTVVACGLHPAPGGTPAPGATTGKGSTGDTSTGKAKSRNIIAWIVDLGPGTPPGPNTSDEVNIYRDLQNRTCQSTALNPFLGTESELKRYQGKSLLLYVGAIAACMSALHNGQSWTVAEHALDQAPTDDSHCLDKTVRSLLKSLVDAHRQHPTWQFVPDTAARGAIRPPCARITGLTPSSGGDGTIVTISGQHLDQVAIADVVLDKKPGGGKYWGEKQGWRCTAPANLVDRPGATVRVQLPPLPSGPGCPPPTGKVTAWLAIETSDEVIDSKEFTYDA